MNRRLVLNIIGRVLLIEGLLMLPSVLIAFFSREGDVYCLLIASLAASLTGFLLSRIRVALNGLRARDGFAAVALSWLMLSLFGGLPFVIGGYMSFVDGLYESISGFTTTGASILQNVESLPKGVMFWRCFTNWIGGMGILMLSLALIPKVGGQAVHLLRAEATGPNPGKLVPKMGETSRILYLIYIGLSIAMTIVLVVLGMSPYDALVHMFSSAGTGGFSNYNASLGYFQSAGIQIAVATFVLLFGVNFSMFFLLIQRNFKDVLKNEELRAYLSIVLVTVVLIAINIRGIYGGVGASIRPAYFQVASIITTTGFSTADFNQWPSLSKALLLFLMVVGACAGSTGGGAKVIRGLVLVKSAIMDVRKMITPRSVSALKIHGASVEGEMIHRVLVFFFVYILLIILGTLLISVDNFDLETSLSASVSAIGNIGPGLGEVGPKGNFGVFSPFSKIVLSMLMLLGRLEIFPVLMLLSPNTWKRN